MEKLISVLFFARDFAHKEHLKTKSYAQHIALNSFYHDVIDLADSLAEAHQGLKGLLKDIPYSVIEVEGNTEADKIEFILDVVMEARKIVDKDTSIQNIIDEIEALFLSTIYKLRFLA